MKKTMLKSAAIGALFASASVMAATNPAAPGLTSTGDLEIQITKGDLVRVSQLADLLFPAFAIMPADTTESTEICVYSTTGGYNLTASSPNANATQLRLASGGNFMPYALSLDDGNGPNSLPHNQQVSGLTNADTSNDLCAGGTNATLSATILETDFNAAPQGAYADTVTLTFNPE